MVRDTIIDEEGRERDILDTIEDTESTNKFNDVDMMWSRISMLYGMKDISTEKIYSSYYI